MEGVGGHGRELEGVWEMHNREGESAEARARSEGVLNGRGRGASWARSRPCSGELAEGRGERVRWGPATCRVPDVEATSGDMLGRPEVVGWLGQ